MGNRFSRRSKHTQREIRREIDDGVQEYLFSVRKKESCGMTRAQPLFAPPRLFVSSGSPPRAAPASGQRVHARFRPTSKSVAMVSFLNN